MKKLSQALLLSCYAISPAICANTDEPTYPIDQAELYHSGWLVGINSGYASGFNESTTRGVGTSDNGGFNLGVMVGYDFALNKALSVGAELDFNYSPDMYSYNWGSRSASVDAFNLPLMATVKYYTPFGLNVFGKGGLNYQRLEVNDSYSSGWTGVLAGGIGYQIQQINIFAQYMYVFGKDLNNASDDRAIAQQMITLGITYHFA